MKKFSSGDFHIINGVLKTAHSLFKRFVRSSYFVHNRDRVVSEIKSRTSANGGRDGNKRLQHERITTTVPEKKYNKMREK